MIASGPFVVAAAERASQHSVLFAEIGAELATINRIRVFSETGHVDPVEQADVRR
jgi:hypothetical protein